MLLLSSLFVLLSLVVFVVLLKKKKKTTKYTPPVLTDWDRRFMAYHEAGHAVCSAFLPEREKLLLVTIDPSSEAFGMIRTAVRPHHNETKVSLSSMISTLLAGHLAEEMFLHSFTTSSAGDLECARKIAADMILKFGMGEKIETTASYSQDLLPCKMNAEEICFEIQKIFRNAEKNARDVLLEHGDLVVSLAEKLLIKKTLSQSEISSFFGDTIKLNR